ncbi:hypothetical protein JT305_09770 [Salmonella enterica subsp. enterica serovar Senftenberg]|nr:hypothetical protein [Salmonella enterica subsp. enterica serovar Senftenberg]
MLLEKVVVSVQRWACKYGKDNEGDGRTSGPPDHVREISPDTSEIRSGSTKRHTTSTQNHITGITKIIFPTQAMSTFTKFKLCAQ